MLSAFGQLVTARYIRRPIIVVGGGRSGTSVLTQALGQHPKVLSYNGEAPFLTDVGGMAFDLEFADDREIRYYQNSVRITSDYIHNALRRLAFESAFGPAYGTIGHMRQLLQGDMRPITATHWCAKSFPSRQVADGLCRIFPHVTYVLIYRNGIEVVHSRSKFHGFRDLSFEQHCKDWRDSIDAFSFLNQYPKSVSVRHEDLVRDTAPVFEKIFRAACLEPDSRPAAFCNTTQLHPLDSTNAAKGIDVRQQLDARPSPFLDWTVEQQRTFTDVCGEVMKQLGYQIPYLET